MEPMVREAEAARACALVAAARSLEGTLYEPLVTWHVRRAIVRHLEGYVVGTSIYSRAARYRPVDTSEAAEAAL